MKKRTFLLGIRRSFHQAGVPPPKWFTNLLGLLLLNMPPTIRLVLLLVLQLPRLKRYLNSLLLQQSGNTRSEPRNPVTLKQPSLSSPRALLRHRRLPPAPLPQPLHPPTLHLPLRSELHHQSQPQTDRLPRSNAAAKEDQQPEARNRGGQSSSN